MLLIYLYFILSMVCDVRPFITKEFSPILLCIMDILNINVGECVVIILFSFELLKLK